MKLSNLLNITVAKGLTLSIAVTWVNLSLIITPAFLPHICQSVSQYVSHTGIMLTEQHLAAQSCY